jgi:hypothetical protein
VLVAAVLAVALVAAADLVGIALDAAAIH